MTSTTTIQSLPLLSPSQAQKTVTHNQALAQIDAMVQLAVEDRDQMAPPAGPATGQAHLVAVGGTGDWAGKDNQVAVWNGTAWEFHVPVAGWRAFVKAEEAVAAWNATAWVTPGQLAQNFPQLGVNGSADSTNRLTVKSDAALFDGASAGHQLKINKAAAGDTASMVFQQGYAAHAEMGLVGSNDFAVKVSPDGTTFAEAVVVENASGRMIAKQSLNLDPAASDPAMPSDGDMWYNSSTGTFRVQQSGLTVDMLGGSGSVGIYTTSNFALLDSTDTSKRARFDLSGLPTGTTDTYSLPNMGGKLALHGFFASRADALSWMAGETMPDGTMIAVSGFAFRKSAGAAAIADMPDWLPALDIYPDHFGENSVPGTTDMTAAIQGAIDHVGALGGGVVNLWQGSYAAAGLTVPDHTYLRGHGIEATTLKLKDAANTWLLATSNYATNSAWANLYGGLSDMTLDGNKANNPTGSLVWFCAYRAKFFRVKFVNSAGSGLVLTAIMSDGTTYLTNHMAENQVAYCHFDTNALHGLHANDGAANRTSDAEVMHNHFNNNGGAGIYAERCNGWKITHNQIYSSGTHCVYVNEFARSVIEGNHLDLRPDAAAAGSRNACIYVNGISSQGAWLIASNLFVMNDTTALTILSMNGLAIMGGSTDPGYVGGNSFVDLTTAQTAEEIYIDPTASTSLDKVKWAVEAEGPGRVLHRNESDLVLEDSADPTKQAVFSASGIATGTQRSFTLPDASGSLALDGVFGSSANGMVPASGGGTANFLRADGTWAAPSGGGGGVGDGDKGDVIVSGTGTVWSLDYTAVNATVAPVWAKVTGTPNTVTGYGITDAVDLSSAQAVAGDKTFSGNVAVTDYYFTLVDNGDPTKKAQFQLSSLSSGVTRTFKLPDMTGVTFFMLDGAPQTVTSSTTFSAASNSFGTSTATGTTGLATGATTSGNTKSVEIGTGGASGSVTDVTIGSSISGAGGSLTINSPSVAFGANVSAVQVSDGALVLKQAADTTKQARFDLAGLTTGTTRSYAMPDSSGTLALQGYVDGRTPKITVSSTAPTSPAVGDLWVN